MRSARYVAASIIAMVWTGLGDREQAVARLTRAYDEDCEYWLDRAEPMADPVEK
jgi:hypothetical protein